MTKNVSLKDLADSLPSRSEIAKTLRDLADSLPSREAIARAAGVDVRTPKQDFFSSLGIFVGGCLFGAALAMLWTSESTRELRERIGEGARDLGDRAVNLGQDMARTASEHADSAASQFNSGLSRS